MLTDRLWPDAGCFSNTVWQLTLPRIFQTSEIWLIDPLLFFFRIYPAFFIFILNFIFFFPRLISLYFHFVAAEKWPLIEKVIWLKSPSSHLAQSGGWGGGRSSGSMFQSPQPPPVLGLSSGQQGEPCNCMCVLCHCFLTSILWLKSRAVHPSPAGFFLLWDNRKPCWNVAP